MFARQRDFLLAEGCNLYQGFYFSPAIPEVKFEAFVKESTSAKMQLV